MLPVTRKLNQKVVKGILFILIEPLKRSLKSVLKTEMERVKITFKIKQNSANFQKHYRDRKANSLFLSFFFKSFRTIFLSLKIKPKNPTTTKVFKVWGTKVAPVECQYENWKILKENKYKQELSNECQWYMSWRYI